ncbi:MAG: hypothetical protein R3D84_01245 [Paracoccaceae bacterium]
MQTKPIILALTTALTLTSAPAFAGAGDSLGACYNHVISSCNQNSNHPQACAEAGMDACDDLHSSSFVLPDGMDLKVRFEEPRSPGGKWRFIFRKVWLVRGDRDNNNGNGGNNGGGQGGNGGGGGGGAKDHAIGGLKGFGGGGDPEPKGPTDLKMN